jgi:hypothetical protein
MVLIITGFRCSGKTLLHRLCRSHPAIQLTDGLQNFRYIDMSFREHAERLRPRLSRSSVLGHEGPMAVGRWKARIFGLCYLIALRAHSKGAVGVHHFETALRCVFPFAAIVGDVSSSYLPRLGRLTTEPGLSVVIMYRDCRDVTSCVLKKVRGRERKARHVLKYDTAEKAARVWLQAIHTMEAHADRAYLIRYEHLVADPKAVLAAFGRWLGVNPHQFSCQGIHTKAVGEFREYLSEEELATVSAVAGPTLRRLGYIQPRW